MGLYIDTLSHGKEGVPLFHRFRALPLMLLVILLLSFQSASAVETDYSYCAEVTVNYAAGKAKSLYWGGRFMRASSRTTS